MPEAVLGWVDDVVSQVQAEAAEARSLSELVGRLRTLASFAFVYGSPDDAAAYEAAARVLTDVAVELEAERVLAAAEADLGAEP